MNERPWLPPSALVGSQIALGASWVLLGALAGRGLLTFSLAALAWVHLVALGWLTLTALAVLFHVIPGFLDAPVRAEGTARAMLWLFMGGVAGLVGGFFTQEPAAIAWGAAGVVAGLLGVCGPMATTVVVAWSSKRQQRPRSAIPFVTAISCVFVALAVAAGIGLAMAGGLAGWWSAAALALAPVHAHLAGGGWLTLLAMGVSMRTLVRITGVRRTRPFLHLAASWGFLVGIVTLVAGLALTLFAVAILGAALCALAALAYVVDAGRMLVMSSDPHLAARAFLASALGYLLGTIALGLLVLSGRSALAPAYVYLALMGWLGQMVSGHMHHIGVRFLLTRLRGDDDETEPAVVLSARLSWTTWALAQGAIVLGCAGLGLGAPVVVEIAAACGVASWAAQLANVARIVRLRGAPS